jgi:exopolysaccharide biosynthesis polyprenyl glycosylphosphotransferase
MAQVYSKIIRNYGFSGRGRLTGFLDLAELLLVSLSFPVSIRVTRNYFIPELDVRAAEAIFFFALILMSWYAITRITSMARVPRTQRYRTLVFQFARVTFIVFLGLVAFKLIFGLTSLPVLLIVVYVSALFIVTLFFRLLSFKILKFSRTYGRDAHNVLMIADAFSDGVIEKLLKQKEWGFRIDTIYTQSKLIKTKYGSKFNIISDESSIKSSIDKQVIDEVIYCRRDVDIDLIRRIVVLCDEIGIIFRLQSSVSPLDPTEFQLKTVNRTRDLIIVDTPSNNLSLILKSMGDIYFSILTIILLIPFFLLIGVIIKLGSKGPVIFVQERIGLRGRKFKLYKFRTMVIDAEEQKKRLRKLNEADGPVFKIRKDPRITMTGRFLRRTGLDELPQLWNVIKGDMSLIGPRPPLEEEVQQYERWQLQRLSVKPGITCTWQIVTDRHNVSFEEWMQLDKKYIENWNLIRDIGLFFKTVKTFFTAGGH